MNSTAVYRKKRSQIKCHLKNRWHKTYTMTSLLGRSTRGTQKKGVINAGNSEKKGAGRRRFRQDGWTCMWAGRQISKRCRLTGGLSFMQTWKQQKETHKLSPSTCKTIQFHIKRHSQWSLQNKVKMTVFGIGHAIFYSLTQQISDVATEVKTPMLWLRKTYVNDSVTTRQLGKISSQNMLWSIRHMQNAKQYW